MFLQVTPQSRHEHKNIGWMACNWEVWVWLLWRKDQEGMTIDPLMCASGDAPNVSWIGSWVGELCTPIQFTRTPVFNSIHVKCDTNVWLCITISQILLIGRLLIIPTAAKAQYIFNPHYIYRYIYLYIYICWVWHSCHTPLIMMMIIITFESLMRVDPNTEPEVSGTTMAMSI